MKFNKYDDFVAVNNPLAKTTSKDAYSYLCEKMAHFNNDNHKVKVDSSTIDFLLNKISKSSWYLLQYYEYMRDNTNPKERFECFFRNIFKMFDRIDVKNNEIVECLKLCISCAEVGEEDLDFKKNILSLKDIDISLNYFRKFDTTDIDLLDYFKKLLLENPSGNSSKLVPISTLIGRRTPELEFVLDIDDSDEIEGEYMSYHIHWNNFSKEVTDFVTMVCLKNIKETEFYDLVKYMTVIKNLNTSHVDQFFKNLKPLESLFKNYKLNTKKCFNTISSNFIDSLFSYTKLSFRQAYEGIAGYDAGFYEGINLVCEWAVIQDNSYYLEFVTKLYRDVFAQKELLDSQVYKDKVAIKLIRLSPTCETKFLSERQTPKDVKANYIENFNLMDDPINFKNLAALDLELLIKISINSNKRMIEIENPSKEYPNTRFLKESNRKIMMENTISIFNYADHFGIKLNSIVEEKLFEPHLNDFLDYTKGNIKTRLSTRTIIVFRQYLKKWSTFAKNQSFERFIEHSVENFRKINLNYVSSSDCYKCDIINLAFTYAVVRNEQFKAAESFLEKSLPFITLSIKESNINQLINCLSDYNSYCDVLKKSNIAVNVKLENKIFKILNDNWHFIFGNTTKCVSVLPDLIKADTYNRLCKTISYYIVNFIKKSKKLNKLNKDTYIEIP